jgi:hypothetical protein
MVLSSTSWRSRSRLIVSTRGYPVFNVALTLTLANFQRLLGNWLVREHANPDLSATLDVTRHSSTCSFNLARRQSTAFGCLEAVLTERYRAAALRQAAIATLELLAKLCSFWL